MWARIRSSQFKFRWVYCCAAITRETMPVRQTTYVSSSMGYLAKRGRQTTYFHPNEETVISTRHNVPSSHSGSDVCSFAEHSFRTNINVAARIRHHTSPSCVLFLRMIWPPASTLRAHNQTRSCLFNSGPSFRQRERWCFPYVCSDERQPLEE